MAGLRPGAALARCEPLEPRRLLAAGDVDFSFGAAPDGAIALEMILPAEDALVALPGGNKVLVVGALSVQRRNSDGTLDPTFGAAGVASFGRTPDGSGVAAVKALVRGDGKIVVAGSDQAGGFFLRFNSDGSRDASFGTNGAMTLAAGTSIQDFALQPDGAIVAMGSLTGVTTEGQSAVYRLTPAGAVDPTFTPFVLSYFAKVAVLADGKVLVGGTQLQHGESLDRFDMTRLNTNGSIDTTFGTGGFVSGLTVTDMLVLPDGRIVTINDGSRVIRLTAAGQIDPTFGTPDNDPNSGLDTHQQIVAGGGGTFVMFGDHFVRRLDAGGKLDESFGIIDTTELPYPRYGFVGHVPRGAVVLPDGNVLLAAINGAFNGELYRLLGGGTAPSPIRIENGTLIVEGTGGEDYLEISGPYDASGIGGFTTVRRSPGFGRLVRTSLVQRISVTSGAGDDDVNLVTTIPTSVFAGDGNDNVYGNLGPATVHGGNGDDSLSIYTSGSSAIYGDAGNDNLDGRDGNDTLYGGDGDDTLLGEEGDDLIFGENGNDSIEGGLGSDWLHGGAGDDVIIAHDEGAIDHIFGDDGVGDSAKADRVDSIVGVESPTLYSAGQPDLAFGDRGVLPIPVPGFIPASIAEVIDGDNSGYLIGGGGGGADLIKLTRDLKLDTRFGNGGIVDTLLTRVTRVQVLDGARLLLSGIKRRQVAGGAFVTEHYLVWLDLMGRINHSHRVADNLNFITGSYAGITSWQDNLVGGNIPVPPPKGAKSIRIDDISPSGSGLIVAATATWDGGTTRLIISRLNPSVDSTFGVNGYVRPLETVSSAEHIIGGYSSRMYVSAKSGGKLVVLALNEDSGAIDTSWGDGGMVTLPDAPAGMTIGSRLLHPDFLSDRMLVVGGSVIVRITADGKIDQSFEKVAVQVEDILLRSEQSALVVSEGRVVALTTGASSAPEVIRVENGTLLIDGTEGDDAISVTTDGATGQTVVRIGFYGRVIDSASFSKIVISAGGGNDVIDLAGAAVASTVSAGSGDDTVIGGAAGELIYGGDGDDRIVGGGGDDSLNGDAGRDAIDGGAGNDLIFGNSGRDKLNGADGNDTIYGGASGDFVHGMAGDDQLFGEGGGDRLFGEAGSDTLDGGAGDDFLFAVDTGPDKVFGSSGSDAAQKDDSDLFDSVEILLP